nr:MAG TPA_asm: hypothetical protein [Caudoviricetes sp.]
MGSSSCLTKVCKNISFTLQFAYSKLLVSNNVFAS